MEDREFDIAKEKELLTKIKTTEYWLSYFCCSELSKKARKQMNRMIDEWKKQVNVGRKYT